MESVINIQAKVIATRRVVVEYCQVEQLAERQKWPLDFDYALNFSRLTPQQPSVVEQELSLVVADQDLGGEGQIFILQLNEVLKGLGLALPNVWQLLAWAVSAEELVTEQMILAAYDLDFTHDPQFPREYFPYIARLNGVVQPLMIGQNRYRVYKSGTIFLAQSGTGQPQLLH